MGKTFQDDWLRDTDFKDWLKKVPNEPTKFECNICGKIRSLSTSGRSALTEHADGGKHKEIVEKLKEDEKKKKNFFNSKCPKQQEASSSQVLQEQKLPALDGKLSFEITKAEIIWILKSIVSGYSCNSVDDFAQTVKAMFPDSNVAANLKLGRTKAMYIATYGIAHHFKTLLIAAINKSPIYTLSFDESLNEVAQQCEMDIIIRFWDNNDNEVKVRYLGSTFFGHGTAVDLVKQFGEVTKNLDPIKLYHISMDGPKVNLKFHRDILEKRSEDLFHSLIDIGTCSLHSVHGAVQTGVEKKTSWGIKKVLKGGFQILHNTPARRDDFVAVTGSTKYPLYFCATRWVENKLVADRMLEVWPNIKKIVQFWEGLPKSKQPSCKSYSNVQDGVHDVLIEAKMTCFSFICSIVEPYLKKYQCEKPMIPFMYNDLKALVKGLLQLITKADVLSKSKTGVQMSKIDLKKEENLLPLKEIELGFGVKDILKTMRRNDTATVNEINTFKKEAQCFILGVLDKIFERSPIKQEFLRSCLVFDPAFILSNNKQGLIKRFKSLLQYLLNLKIMSPTQCDTAVQEYDQFCDNELKKFRVIFEEFNENETRLDHFFFTKVNANAYETLSFVIKLILTLSHGQACVERQFSVNNRVLQDNMGKDTIIARKHIINHMNSENLKPYTIDIDKTLLLAVKGASLKYKTHLEEKRNEIVKSDAENKKVVLANDMAKLKEQCDAIKKSIVIMEKDVGESMELAEKKQEWAYVMKSNALKRKCEETRGDLKVLEEQYSVLAEKKKRL